MSIGLFIIIIIYFFKIFDGIKLVRIILQKEEILLKLLLSFGRIMIFLRYTHHVIKLCTYNIRRRKWRKWNLL